MKKGLRQALDSGCRLIFGRERFPDEEGIKTAVVDLLHVAQGRERFPDEEGIKTNGA